MPAQEKNNSHLHFNNPQEGVVEYKQKTRVVTRDDDGLPKYYQHMKDTFRNCTANFNSDKNTRHQNRNNTLRLPQHIDYILINFFGPFDIEKFTNRYKQNFGLVPVKFELFNSLGLFAIDNDNLFNNFFRELQTFQRTNDHTGNLPYNVDIRYIKDFRLLSDSNIISYRQLYDSAFLNLVDVTELFHDRIHPIEESLKTYLHRNNITFIHNQENKTIQIWGASQALINEIIANFDIIHSVNSSLAGVVAPGSFNTPIRSFGFTLVPPSPDAPVIGILDSGISSNTPLNAIVKNANNEYDLTGTGSLIDNLFNGCGHGTGVAGFAALGSQLITNHTGNKQADAWLLSIKILDTNSPRVSDLEIINLIRKAHEEYGVRIFVLTVTENDSKGDNEPISAFAFNLDKLAYELDILIIISAGNISQDYFIDQNSGTARIAYPDDFIQQWSNIKSPSESMNNLAIGSCAGNFENEINTGIAVDNDFPALYSTKFNYDFESDILSSKQSNKYLNKPDILYYGGDWDNSLDCSITGLKHLSAKTGVYYDKNTGTSFSAGLIANIAAKIIYRYPSLSMQSVKALLISSAFVPKFNSFYNNFSEKFAQRIIGNGIPVINECLHSTDNSVTIIIEDEISPDRIKSYPLHIPEYLLSKTTKSTVLDIKATLCYSFEPLLNNQMAYCPIHIGFGILKNMNLNEWTTNTEGKQIPHGLNGNSAENIKIKNGQGWSEDYYFKSKLLSNVQKMELVYNIENISGNDNTFKLAINCKRHKLMNEEQKNHFNRSYKFSITMNFQERPVKNLLEGNLYYELFAVNTLEAITDLEAELNVE
ncbi:MAG: hypothetical protein A2275_08130 [Bacteroidetes bacterium RIFOXYA12_FULL_35_11]|nr:MAG: hypothetical protein A2X01_11270 [Bacteroidetes bacterium GWF2_35_48]OFY82635.1 MAG: hypothetical protein A2275_08130 [Bacteroidetes bacterium RIFOXYA12_FULL_35_11]OFY96576.1 MAG: hypothetical protein A2309_08045 [Bacteroidetes bacterium RIFOXYB2_FULL_35_7]OFY97244.1 MAG: hypothetical protein A2491_16020 [Bacteroidetes bacterium RIFOXYC12_FULL_35_7]HBX51342.1 hypothetical protein [Bacteroidales bacterium]